MLKIHRFNCAGLDVHKNLIVATIGITDKKTRVTEYIQKDFSSLNYDLYNLKNWLIEHKCFDVCMESTGKYWIPVFNVLETEAKMNIVLVHPKYVKAIKGKKTDKKDSKWICDLFKHDLLKSSFIPSKDIRELRDLSRYRFKLICMRTSERNRYQNSMTVSNIALASVVSDPFGKTAKAIMNEVLSTEAIDEAKITKLIHGSCRNKDKIIESLKNSKIEPDQRFKITEIQSHMNELDKHIEAVEIEIIKRASRYFDNFIHITEIDGIQLMSAILIISEIGDINRFNNPGQVLAFAGLDPSVKQSGTFNASSTKMSKRGSSLLRYALVLAANNVQLNTKTFNDYYNTNIKVCKRHGHKREQGTIITKTSCPLLIIQPHRLRRYSLFKIIFEEKFLIYL